MKHSCECGQLAAAGKKICARCFMLQGTAVDSKMTESWQERRARKAANGLPDGDKFPMKKYLVQ